MKAINLLKKEFTNCKNLGELKLYNAKREFALHLELVTFNEVELMEFTIKTEKRWD